MTTVELTPPRAERAGAATRPEARLAPPLENGDRLTRLEFERRYAGRPDLKKAELIEGRVYMPSPVHFLSHGEPHSQIITWLGVYAAATPGVRLGDNASVRLDADNEVQPDALLRLEQGGRSRLSDDDFVEGAPELIVEVAATSASYDLHDKLNVYRRTGVPEYLVWRVHDRRLDAFRLEEGVYKPAQPDDGGVFHSRVFPGLRLHVPALLAGQLAEVLAELQRGLASDEHKAFIEQLRAAGK